MASRDLAHVSTRLRGAGGSCCGVADQGIAIGIGIGAAFNQSIQRVNNEGSPLEGDADSVDGCLGDFLANGGYRQNRLADVADDVGCQRRVGGRGCLRQVLGGQDTDHAIHCQCLGVVHADNASGRQRAGQQTGKDHAFLSEILSITGCAGDLAFYIRRREVLSYVFVGHDNCPEARITPFR